MKKRRYFRIWIPASITFFIFAYLWERELYPGAMEFITSLTFPLMLVVIGILWYRERSIDVSLQDAIGELKLAKVRLREGYLSTMKALALAIEARDPYTRGHSSRVVDYSLLIAEELNLPGEDIETIRNAGVLHDIGKIAISDHVLGKPGELSEDEFKSIRKHPALGVDILKPLPFLKAELSIILEHHERVDGEGYHNLRKEDIPLASRIIAVADSFDAMTSTRPYRDALSREAAIAELKNNAGTQFDKDIVDIFLKVLAKKEFRVGKSAGAVTEPSPHLAQ